MVVSRKQFTPKKTDQAGGFRKRFTSCNSTATRKTDQAGGSRKQFTAHNDTKKNPTQMGGARKTKSQKDGSTANMHEVCVGCHREGRKTKVRIDDVRKETFKGKGNTMRARLVGKCEHGHKWYRFTKA
jgi:hypothetical protein